MQLRTLKKPKTKFNDDSNVWSSPLTQQDQKSTIKDDNVGEAQNSSNEVILKH
jgi:hypothetical protein